MNANALVALVACLSLLISFNSIAQPCPEESAFGNSLIGDNSGTLTPNKVRVTSFDLSEKGVSTRVRAFVEGGVDAQPMVVVLYSDLDGRPFKLLAESNEEIVDANSHGCWTEQRWKAPVTLDPGKYWLGILSGASTSPARFRFFSSSTRNRISASNDYISGPALTFGKAESVLQGVMSVYMLYERMAPPPEPANVMLRWTVVSPPEGTNGIGYKIYHGPTSGVYDKIVDVGSQTGDPVSHTLPGFVIGEYRCFVVTAYSMINGVFQLESVYSNEKCVTMSKTVTKLAI